jgi:4-aminobutyrate aminotransferase-like enzyme
MGQVQITDQEVRAGKDALLSGWGEMGDLIVESGQGAVFRDTKGKEYIDCTSQAWALTTGFNHPRVIEAVRKQLDNLTHVRSTFYSVPQLLLAKKLSEIAPGSGAAKLKRVSFSLHGSVASEGAMKLALNNKPGKFMSLYNGYHGRTMASMAVSWPHPNQKISNFTGDVVRVPGAYCYRCSYGLEYPSCGIRCAEFIDEAIEKNGPITAFMMEAVQGNGGQVIFPKEFHTKVREICSRHEMLLIYDEVQTGFGRMPSMFACQLYDVVPDILVYGKGIGGGFPLAGTLSREGLPVFEPGDHGYTFGHFPLSLVAAMENIRIIEEEKLLERCGVLGERIVGRLNAFKEKYSLIGDIRGVGLMIGIELVRDRKTKEPAVEETQAFAKEALERGLVLGTSLYRGLGNVLKIKPPAIITDEQVDRALDIFEELLKKYS